MTDPGLTDRLRQKSRRAGLAVGLSMALTIAICIGGATLIYAGLIDPLSQFVPIPGATRSPVQAVPNQDPANASDAPFIELPGQAAGANRDAAQAPTEAPPPAPPPTPTPEPTSTPDAFEPTHQITAARAVNLRPQPSSTNEPGNEPIRALPPSTPLQFLGERASADNPDDAPGWMRFRTEEGDEGWIREIDVTAFAP